MGTHTGTERHREVKQLAWGYTACKGGGRSVKPSCESNQMWGAARWLEDPEARVLLPLPRGPARVASLELPVSEPAPTLSNLPTSRDLDSRQVQLRARILHGAYLDWRGGRHLPGPVGSVALAPNPRGSWDTWDLASPVPPALALRLWCRKELTDTGPRQPREPRGHFSSPPSTPLLPSLPLSVHPSLVGLVRRVWTSSAHQALFWGRRV